MLPPVKAFLEIEGRGDFPCTFNPAELTIAKTNTWKARDTAGKSAAKSNFQKGSPGTLSLELTFDTTDSGEAVTRYTSTLMALMEVDPATESGQAKTGRPPWVRFHWADFHSFKAFVESLQVKFTFFSTQGVALRAKATLKLKQFEEEDATGPQNPTSGTPHPHRVHQVRPGETLDRIAALHYKNPHAWRDIADRNGIIDPLRLEPGTTLVIPEPQGVGRA
jgi:nucleoid-associated protein YgaU